MAVLEAEETGTVDMVYSSSQHCGGDGGDLEGMYGRKEEA